MRLRMKKYTEQRRFELPREYEKCILQTRNLTTVSSMRATSDPPPQDKVGAEKYFSNSLPNLCNIVLGEGGALNIDVPKTVVKFLAGLIACIKDFRPKFENA